jgi:hypothetical protein
MLMVTRTGLHRTGRRMIVKPFVVLAAKCLGPGRLRLEMVKLAHDLGGQDDNVRSLYGRQRPVVAAGELSAAQPTQRAA